MSAVTKVVRATCQMWIPLAVLALTLTATTWPRSRETNLARSAMTRRIVTAQLTNVPSHNRLYRASLDLTGDSVWIVRVQSAAGAPVRNARLAMDAWMPEQESVAQTTPTASETSSAGAYRVRPLALDRAGWWNVRVQISAGRQRDSLAFNVALR